MMDYTVHELKIPAHVGGMSLIGTTDARPVGWGNYFWFQRAHVPNVGGEYFEGIRCVNMWAENLNTARKRFFKDEMVKVRLYSQELQHWAIVIDDRLPDDSWLYNELCFTGGRLPPKEIGLDMYKILGDPKFEAEQFIDREMYYAKRGGKYHQNGIVSYHPSISKEQLVEELLERRKVA